MSSSLLLCEDIKACFLNNNNIYCSGRTDVYEVILNCVSQIGGEGESVAKTISVVDILPPPSQIEAVASPLHTLNLSWIPPDSIDLSSSLFIITYSPVSNYSQNLTTVYTDE